MSAIIQALEKLDFAVDKLEGRLDGLESTLKGQQRDMFAAPSNQNKTEANRKAIAKKLDQAISKVEKILKEG
jgi:sugar-specific transcriptional regulator TrmB